jgi:threonylcarbamoyladenosine tRNA methylthiotransferase MtaB
MEQMLIANGYSIVPFDENIPADVYIINTCSVTNIADRKSRQMLHKAKKMNPEAVVVAAGCYVQADSENIKKDAAVDIILGNNRKINIVEVLDGFFADKSENDNSDYDLLDMSVAQPYEKLSIERVNEHTRAYIKIQDGCNQFCSYCIIPYLRGRIRSREMEDIVNEVEKLASAGYHEIVLTGIHLTSYGADNNKGSLLEVIKKIHDIDGIERIRLGSLEPRVVTEEFVSEVSSLKKVCPHFHLSLQSGCDTVLKAMNRKYTTEEYLKGCEILRKYYDNPAITTDVIVGFPNESDEEFETTYEFVKKVHFYEMHIFKYSRRKGTVADRMPNQVDERVKTKRSGILMELEKEMSAAYRQQFVGTTQKVLIEEMTMFNGKQYAAGYTPNYVRVLLECDSKKAAALNNKIIDVYCESLTDDNMYILGKI